jgi:pimeloyl-ACP methyl ester carboxylesterase
MEGLQDSLVQKGYLVFNLDLPGFGKTQLTKSEMNVSDYVAEISKFIESKNIYKPTLVGHSFGGKIALKLALDKPELVSNIVLIAASGVKPNNENKKSIFKKVSGFGKKLFQSDLLKGFYKPVRKFYYYYIVRERDFFNAGEVLQKTFININNEYYDELLGKVSVPTLIIWGENDKVTPLWMADKLQEEIPDAVLKVVEKTKHSLPIVKPEIVSEIIYNYLNVFN